MMKSRHLDFLAFLLSLAAATALFRAFPELDPAVARWFHADGHLAGNDWAWSRIGSRWFPWLGALLVAWNAFVVILRLRARGPRMPLVRSAAMLLLVAVFAFGVSGHAAGAFALIALGALGARRMRRRWWLTGVAVGSLVAIGRMAQGSQFASEVVFSLLLVWGVTLALRASWLWVTLQRRRMHRLLADFGSLWAGSPRPSA